MREHGSETELLEQAMEALQESTTMLQVAGKLLDQGNVEEARRLRDEARAQRNVSLWLMAKANTLEHPSGGMRGHYHQHSSTSH
jgi:hypothetical protein